MRVVVIDNYDSFTYNLVQAIGTRTPEVEVFRNDALDADGVMARRPDALVVSPGPCTPAEAGHAVNIVRRAAPSLPVLGVCLGHQAVAAAFGGRVTRAARVVHGKATEVLHDGHGLMEGLPSPLAGGRYHSLVVERDSLPGEVEVCAWTPDDVVMGLRHRRYPAYGLQFHPESVLTPEGPALLERFLDLAARGSC